MEINKQKKMDEEYSFKPRMLSRSTSNLLNKSDTNISIPRYIKLNGDFKIRENKLHDKRIKQAEEMQKSFSMKKSNSSSDFFKRKFSQTSITPLLTNNKTNHYEKLYNDANKQIEHKLKITDNFYKSADYSFNPNINENIKVRSSFSERNEQFIKLKQELLKKAMEGNKDKGKTINKREEKELVNRLYTKEVEKLREDNKLLNELRKDHKIKFRTNKKREENKDILAVLSDIEKNLKEATIGKEERNDKPEIKEISKEKSKKTSNVPTPKISSKEKRSSKELKTLKQSRDDLKKEKADIVKVEEEKVTLDNKINIQIPSPIPDSSTDKLQNYLKGDYNKSNILLT
jgi:hypothetical protein